MYTLKSATEQWRKSTKSIHMVLLLVFHLSLHSIIPDHFWEESFCRNKGSRLVKMSTRRCCGRVQGPENPERLMVFFRRWRNKASNSNLQILMHFYVHMRRQASGRMPWGHLSGSKTGVSFLMSCHGVPSSVLVRMQGKLSEHMKSWKEWRLVIAPPTWCHGADLLKLIRRQAIGRRLNLHSRQCLMLGVLQMRFYYSPSSFLFIKWLSSAWLLSVFKRIMAVRVIL